VKEPVIVDSACLIALDQVKSLVLLSMLYDPVFIPPAVSDEIPSAPFWITVETPVDAQTVDALRKQLGKGESEAIALASEKACRIVLDDAKARSIAKHMNLKVIGTVGILVKAKLEGIIQHIRPILEGLRDNKFFMSDALIKEALRLCSE
jgi:predicted nucleic acid-binding protein